MNLMQSRDRAAILGYGAYIPYYRLPTTEIARVWKGGGSGPNLEKAVAEAELPAKGFEFQVATLHLLKAKWKIVEVPFTFTERTSGKSKLGLADVAKFFLAVLRMAL